MLTVNAAAHPVLRRMHRPGAEKRSVVIVPESDWDNWLRCRNPELARSFLHLYPAERMASAPEPVVRQTTPTSRGEPETPKPSTDDSLF